MKKLFTFFLFTFFLSNYLSSQEITTQPVNETVCEGDNASFNIVVTPIGDYAYQWYFMTTSASEWIKCTTINYYIGGTTASLTYENVQLELDSNLYKCKVFLSNDTLTSDSAMLTVMPLPVVNAGDNASICFSDDFQISTASAANYDSLKWTDNESGSFSDNTIINPFYYPPINFTGDVILTLTVYSPCGDSIDDAILTVNTNPTANFSVDNDIIYVDHSVTFSDESSNDVTEWEWAFVGGNPETSNDQNPPEILYSNAGQYDVSLEVYNDFGCSDILMKQDYVLVIPLPDAGFTANDVYLTPGDSTKFQPDSTNYIEAWAWTFNGGSPDTSNDQNPTVTYDTIGDYTVSLTVTDIIGTEMQKIEANFIHVGNKPEADFSVDTTMAATEYIIHFTDLSTTYMGYQNSWEWHFGDGNSSTSRNPSHKYSDVGIYTISLVVTNDFGSDNIIEEDFITIGEKPNDDFSISQQKIFKGDSVQFSNIPTSPNTEWTWIFEGGQPDTSNEQSPKVLYSLEGIYSVELSVSNPFGSVDKDSIISVYCPIEISIFSNPKKICTGDTATFDANISGGSKNYSYKWEYYSDSVSYSSSTDTLVKYGIRDSKDSLKLEITDNELSYKKFEEIYRNFAIPLPPKPIIVSKPEMITDSTLPTLLICTDSGYVYQWFRDNDTIVGATLQFYYPPNYDFVFSSGEYFVRIKDQITRCFSEKSNIIEIPEIQKDFKQIKIYPNPNNGSFIIQIPKGIFVDKKDVIARLWSFDGKLVSKFIFNNQNLTNEIITNIPYIKGIYFIEVISNNGEHYNTKFIID